uniref:Uncharacterized protein n=1 Tax=Manihot esculenta TaxID=3983 RepID=A0A2C9VXM0_MANES
MLLKMAMVMMRLLYLLLQPYKHQLQVGSWLFVALSSVSFIFEIFFCVFSVYVLLF